MSSLAETVPLESNSTSSNRWRLNNQLIDSDAPPPTWDLADEIVRLKIADTVREVEDGPIRTSPNSKIAPGAVSQLADGSPLDSASSITSSPHTPGHQINVSHSRESSADISSLGIQESTGVALEPVIQSPFKGGNMTEVKERPHSFSGGLSSADLRRLQQAGGPEVTDHLQQQQQWAVAHGANTDDKQFSGEQPSYPSLANTVHRPPQLPILDYRASDQASSSLSRDDLMQQIDYNIQQRAFNNAMSPASAVGQGTLFAQNRSASVPSPLYRQPRTFPQQNVIPSPSGMAYPPAPSMPLGNSQQLYDMMLPPPDSMNPAVNRVQQQHNVFRGTHHHSTSDPSAIRDAAALALLNGNIPFNPPMFPGPGMYTNQFYRAQDVYRPPDAAAQAMAARLQAQYTGTYGMVAPPIDPAMSSPTSTNTIGQNGPSANNRKLGLYKTELCRSWEEKGSCRYGAKCQFAHGEEELRSVARHPKYKTEICRTFWVSGSCPYGKRCCFIHTELPTSGNAGAASATGSDSAPPPNADGRARSMSTNSDPNDASVSLLARISAKRSQESSTNSSSTPVDSPSNFQFTRPPTGSLRVDTSVDTSLKQNKSAYPTFTRNGVLLPAQEDIKAKSPAPVTAGPDLGRHNSSRLEIVGYNQRVNAKPGTPPSSRNSIGGADEMNYSPSPVSGPGSGHSYTLSGDGGLPSGQTRANGHVRAGSAGNWANLTRNNVLASSFPSPGGDAINSPWSTTELAVGSSRFPDKTWA